LETDSVLDNDNTPLSSSHFALFIKINGDLLAILQHVVNSKNSF